MSTQKVLTLVIVHDHEKVLLGLKKRGFGAGRWNGFGGKVHEGETIELAAYRELNEEAGITTESMSKQGVLRFSFQETNEDLEVHLFSVRDFSGQIVETEEMRPQWFLHSEIPFSEMWVDDQYWLPQVLRGKKVKGSILFDNPDSQNILDKVIEVDE